MPKARKHFTRPPADRYSSRRAAAYLGIKPSTVHNLVSQGKLEREKVSHRVIVFRRSELDRFLSERGEKPANPDA